MATPVNDKAAPLAELRDLNVNAERGTPLFRVLYLELRARMLDGRLQPGTRIPSSRALASQLNLGRNTVISAFEQLLAEGYLESRLGSGTYVAIELPDHWLAPVSPSWEDDSAVSDTPLSEVAAALSGEKVRAGGGNHSFCVGMPDLKAFPLRTWNRLSHQYSQVGMAELMGYSSPAGLPSLREAIADYVRSSRAVNCEARQVLVTSGAQQALDLCARLLLNPGDQAVIEEPGYMGARRTLMAAGAELNACPVDHQGIQVSMLDQLPVSPRLVYVTPANQYPLGIMMTLERRTALLNWAHAHQCWVVEDDYDSEYHYAHRPLASLQGLARQQQVIYIGSFSKVLFPGLRLGYMVLPPALVDVFTRAKMEHSGETNLHSQAVTAAFLQEGHFGRHVRKMRVNYGSKLQVMLEACRVLSPWCRIHSHGAGMHLALELKAGISEEALADALRQHNLLFSRLSQYYVGHPKRYGLVLGFANSSEAEIFRGVGFIREVLLKMEAGKVAREKAGTLRLEADWLSG